MNKIDFVITSDLLYYAKELHPQPINKFVPTWFKNITHTNKKNYKFEKYKLQKNISSCPSFLDVFSDGIVLLAPVDYLIKVDLDGSWNWQVPIKFDKHKGNNIPEVDVHEDTQMIDHLPSDSGIVKVFKINLPIEIFTPKGYSSRQIPFPYSFNNHWEAVYGLLKTDKMHEASIQIFIKTHEEILIKQGTPLCVYIPYKRKKVKHNVINYEESKKYKNILNKNLLKTHGTFTSPYYKYHHKD